MKMRLKKAKAFPFYFCLLPLFFVLHALATNFHPTLIPAAIGIWLLYTLLSLLLYALLLRFYQHPYKAAIATVLIASFYFFFAALHDFVKEQLQNSFLTKYQFFLPLFLLLLFSALLLLKRLNNSFAKISRYLNLLFVILIFVDMATVTVELNQESVHVKQVSARFRACDRCTRPDVYLIIADEYAGKKELEDIFSYRNDSFRQNLQAKGFYLVPGSISNYNATVYSMASLLNMGYLQGLAEPVVTHKTMLACRHLINTNQVADFFHQLGYRFYNCSFFSFYGHPQPVNNTFFPTPTALLNGATLLNRLQKDLWFNFASKETINKIKRHEAVMNKKIEILAQKAIVQPSPQPKFVYVHLSLPHHPYFYDRNGNLVPVDSLSDAQSVNKKAYLSYLQYANKKYLQLIDLILKNAKTPPLIIFMSDHGFRQFTDDTNHAYYFQTINAVLFPNQDYHLYYPGISAVNQFRVVLNSQFGQQLPLLKDSTIFLKE